MMFFPLIITVIKISLEVRNLFLLMQKCFIKEETGDRKKRKTLRFLVENDKT